MVYYTCMREYDATTLPCGSTVGRTLAAVVAGALILVPATAVSAQSMRNFDELSITPSDVHQHVLRVRAEIDAIRGARGATDAVRDPGRQSSRLPIHVFAKANELRSKIARFQVEIGMQPIDAEPLPFREVLPENVFGNIDGILEELGTIQAFLDIVPSTSDPPFIAGRTPSDVYRTLWEASYAFDALVAEITPPIVHQSVQRIAADLLLIADRLEIETIITPPRVEEGIVPRDVIRESFVNMYLIARIQHELAMPPFIVPPIPGGAITPTNVFDTTLAILAELHRIKVVLGIEQRSPVTGLNQNATPGAVRSMMLGVQAALREVLAAIREEA